MLFHDGIPSAPATEHRVELAPFAIRTWKIMA